MSADLATVVMASFGIFAALVVAGFVLLFGEIRRLETKFDNKFDGLETRITALRTDLAEEFRAQRAEVSAQVAAFAAAINASRS